MTPAQLSVAAWLKERLEGMGTRPFSLKVPYWRRVPLTEPPRPEARVKGVRAVERWVWLKSVQTLSPAWKRVTLGPTLMMVPDPSERGFTEVVQGKGYCPSLRVNRYQLNGGLLISD